MRSDAIDLLLSNFLEMPARVTWEGALADSIRGIFEGARLELSGVAILALPFDRMVLRARRFQFTPGLPARIRVEEPRIEVSIDQRQLDRWLRRARAPFALRLSETALEVQIDVAGLHTLRQELAQAWQDRSTDQGYGELRLLDRDDQLIGRSAQVGSGMILFNTPAPA